MQIFSVRNARPLGALLALSLTATLALAQTESTPQASPSQPAPAPAASQASPAPAVQSAPAASPAPLRGDEAASHDLGLIFGNQLRTGGLESRLSLDALMNGIKEGLEGKPLTPQVKERVNQFLRASRDALGGSNKQAAREFLAKNASAEGIKMTKSGLQYRVLVPGNSAAKSPGATDQVKVQYRGTLLDGTEFDSSYGHAPVLFRVNGVIPGWQEALQLMKPGAKWKLYVPPELAYDLHTPPGIPPGSLLVFDIELIDFDAAPAQAAVTPKPATKPQQQKPAQPATQKPQQ